MQLTVTDEQITEYLERLDRGLTVLDGVRGYGARSPQFASEILAALDRLDPVLVDGEVDVDAAVEVARLLNRYVYRSAVRTLMVRLYEYVPDLCEWCDVWCEASEDWSGVQVCQPCADSAVRCDWCRDLMHAESSYEVQGLTACPACWADYCHWCEVCDEAVISESHEGHDDDGGCACEPLTYEIRFAATTGTIRHDERFSLELPAGAVPTDAITAAENYLYGLTLSESITHSEYVIGSAAMRNLEPDWQTKRGNWPRRFSSAAYKGGWKVPPAVLAEVGNLIRRHVSDSSVIWLELTRDLNQSAAAFAHEDSCWWQSYYQSRCDLKARGGIGLRAYRDETAASDDPDGRAWVQQIRRTEYGWQATTEHSEPAAGFVVYNGYGTLSALTAARIVAQLTGFTYRRVTLYCGPQYVNANSGYLVGPADLLADAGAGPIPSLTVGSA